MLLSPSPIYFSSDWFISVRTSYLFYLLGDNPALLLFILLLQIALVLAVWSGFQPGPGLSPSLNIQQCEVPVFCLCWFVCTSEIMMYLSVESNRCWGRRLAVVISWRSILLFWKLETSRVTLWTKYKRWEFYPDPSSVSNPTFLPQCAAAIPFPSVQQ